MSTASVVGSMVCSASVITECARRSGYDTRSVRTVGPQNFECQTRGAEAVVDVHDGNAGTAAGEHRVQGNKPTLGNACADRRRNRDYWRAKQSGDDSR